MSPTVPVVSNAGPLMALAKPNLLHLLKELYGHIHFAQSVYDETVVEGLRHGHEDARTLRLFFDQMGWRPAPVDSASVPARLHQMHLDKGERDTLAMAETLGSAMVLMDEAQGRHVARRRGLAVRGTLGVLIEAHRHGLIQLEQLRLYCEEIAGRQDIWISPALVDRVLGEALDQE